MTNKILKMRWEWLGGATKINMRDENEILNERWMRYKWYKMEEIPNLISSLLFDFKKQTC